MSGGLGALTVSLGLDAAEFVDGLTKAEQTAKKSADNIARANQSAEAQADRFLASLQRQADTFGMTSTQVAAYEARLRGVSDQAAPLIARLQAMKDAQDAANKSGSEIKGSAHEMEGLSFQTASAKRELIVLAHELSQGNYKKFGGSLLVLAEQTGAAALLFSGMGIAALGAAAAVAVFAAAAVLGAADTEALRKALVLTGNYAGATDDQVDALSHTLATKTKSSIGDARDALMSLVASGQVGPKVLAPMTEAVLLYAKATGRSAEDVGQEFAKMGDDVTAFALEHNKQMNLLTLAQYQQIKALQEQGKAEEAELVVSQAVTDHLANVLKPNLGYLGQAWEWLGKTAGDAWNAMKGAGKADTVDDAIARQMERIEAIRRSAAIAPPALFPSMNLPRADTAGAESAAIDDLRLLKLAKTTAAEQALAKAESLRDEKAAVSAQAYVDNLDKELQGTNRLKRDLDELDVKLADIRKKGGIVTPEHEAALRAGITKRDTPAKKEDDGSAELKKQLDGQLKLIKDAAKQQADAYAFGNQVIDGIYHDGLISQATYFDDQKALRAGALAAQLSAIDKEIAAEKALADNPALKPAARIETENKIALASQQRAELVEKARQGEVIASQQSARAAEQLADQYDNLRASVLAASGDDIGAAAIKTARELRDATRLVTQAGGDSAVVAKYAAQLTLQAQAAQLEKDYALLLENTARIESEIAVDAKLNGRDEIETLAAVRDARQAVIGQLREQAQAAADLAAASGTKADTKRAADLSLAVKKAESEIDPLAAKFNGILEDSASSAFSGFIKGTRTAKQAFSDFTSSVLDNIAQIAAKQLANALFGSVTGGIGGFLSSLIGGQSSTGAAGAGTYSSIGVSLGGAGGASSVGMSLAVGTSYVPYDGFAATLHKGEAVLPAKYNPDNPGATGLKDSASTDSSQVINNISVGAGVARGEVMTMLQSYGQRIKGEILTSMRNKGVFSRA